MPSFPCPSPYVWTEDFRTFYNNVDNEHKGLFRATFSVSAFPNSRRALAILQQVMAQHFCNEENMMLSCQYEGFPPHKAAHTEFLGRLNGLVAPVAQSDIDYCKQWLVDHIKTIDFSYRGRL
uniref:Hemerythrin n=1 Tax=Magelona berkeleyi TaxID=1490213 RepID=A0A1S6QD16_9ANNE|nr:hemerythrin [Magelona berkeleyi]